jgi:hypothetical protein
MGLCKSKPPKPDARIGEAAMKQAEIADRAQQDQSRFAERQLDMAAEYQKFMLDQAAVTNGWAAEDRARYTGTFVPLQDDWIAEAQAYDSPERKAMAADEAVADVRQQFALGRQQNERQMAAVGVNPNSGRYQSSANRMQTTEALAAAGGANAARRRTEDTGRNLRASAINMGSGLAVNPGTSMGLSNSAGSTGMNAGMNGVSSAAGMVAGGAQTAMQGQQGMINGLTAQFNQQMQGYQARNAFLGDLAGAAGSVAGFAMMSSKDYKTKKGKPSMPSSKDMKTSKRKPMSVLNAVRDMPVEEWEYKEGMGDGGGKKHIGPYAEDFQKATGLGNGKEISIIDAIGVTMGAVQELAAKVDNMAAPKRAAA